MPAFRNDEEDEDPTFDEVSSMADRLGLQGKNRAAYIDDHMQQLGYEAIQSRESYRKPTKEDDGGGQGPGSRWGFGRQQGPGAGGGGRPRGGGGGREDDTF